MDYYSNKPSALGEQYYLHCPDGGNEALLQSSYVPNLMQQ